MNNKTGWLLPALMMVVSGLAQAQTATESENKRAQNRLLEEVIVTAQKREENLQDVPIAISAYKAEALDAFGIASAQDLERITPGLTITNAGGFFLAYLRGIGTDAFLPGADPSVPFYLDGIAMLTVQGGIDTLGKVERIEVLKGPQGTLFGRNATGGAINIITPEPGDEFYSEIQLELAEYSEKNIQAFVNIPLLESLSLAVSAYSQEHDNYVENDSGPLFDVMSKGGRVKLRWDLTEDFSATLNYSRSHSSGNNGLVFENTRVAPVFAAALPQDPKADRKVSLDYLSGSDVRSTLAGLTIEWNLDWAQIKLIGSDQELQPDYVAADFDKSNLPIVNITTYDQQITQKTGELQILSGENAWLSDRLEWVAGAFWSKSAGGYDPIIFNVVPFGSYLPAPLEGLLSGLGLNTAEAARLFNHGVLVSEGVSVYSQGTWSFTDALDLTVGVRYQQESRDLDDSRVAVGNPDGSEGAVIREDHVPQLEAEQLSPKIALQWRPFGDETQFYASWGRAFKSPTYNTVNVTDTPEDVKEEQVDSYEIGFKSELLDGNLRLNGAAFFIQQENLLTGTVALSSGGVVAYSNAGDSEVSGAEMDMLLTPMPVWNPGLVVSVAATYLNTEYTSYPNGAGFDDDTGVAFGDGGTTPLPARDFSGNEIARAPEWTGTLSLNQNVPLKQGAIEFGVDVTYNSGFYFLPQNSELSTRDEYALINARASWFYDPWGLQLTVFGENITDETYNFAVFTDDFGRNQILNPPGIYGVKVKWAY